MDGNGRIIPEAWGALLTRPQACAYLAISEETFRRICPIPPVDLGNSLLRWNRAQLDTWVAGLPARLRREQERGQDAPPQPVPVTEPADERRLSSIQRAKARAEATWKTSRSHSSSASRARAAR